MLMTKDFNDLSDVAVTSIFPRFVQFDMTMGIAQHDKDKFPGLAVKSTYVYDAARPIHMCDIRPSYELTLLNVTAYCEQAEGLESLYQLETDIYLESDIYIYVYCHDLSKLRTVGFSDWPIEEGDTYEEAWDQVVDHYRGNIPDVI